MSPEPQPGTPDKFDGRNFPCRQFVNQLGIHFHIYAEHYLSDESKVNYLLTLLKGAALDWVSNLINSSDPTLHDYPAFLYKLSTRFGQADKEQDAENKLSFLKQGRDTVDEYATKFQEIACNVPWNERALIHQFRMGLNDSLKDELAGRDLPNSLEDTIILATRLDSRLIERARERALQNPNPRYPTYNQKPNPNPSPRDEYKDSFSKEERRQERATSGGCFYCGKPGHSISNCMARIRAQQLKEGAQSQH